MKAKEYRFWSRLFRWGYGTVPDQEYFWISLGRKGKSYIYISRKGIKMNTLATPQPKVIAGGVAGAAALVTIWVAGQFNVDVPAEVAVAFSTLLSFAASYLKKP